MERRFNASTKFRASLELFASTLESVERRQGKAEGNNTKLRSEGLSRVRFRFRYRFRFRVRVRVRDRIMVRVRTEPFGRHSASVGACNFIVPTSGKGKGKG